ncbi:MAG: response regulator [Armatimonadetes bacterium]|nr:response regulator [Armatimonadota bacterium]
MSSEKILVVEDDPLVREALKLTLKQAGYDVSTASDGREAISLAEKESFDLFIMDVRMPGIDGIESLSRMKESQPEAQSIVMTGYADRDAPVKALRLGAADYFYKPFDPEELLRSVRHHLEKCRLTRNERVVSKRLLQSNLQTLKQVALLVEDRNRWFRGHSRRTAEWAVRVARKLELDPERIELLETAALLHDIGQIYVQEEILGKPGELSPEEREAVRAHPVLAREFLGAVSEFREILYIIHHHHEWWNGKGYPSGLSGEEIPIESRILSVCEAYDALISPRPHRGAFSTDEAFEVLRTHSGTQFDGDIVKTLISRVNHPEDGSDEGALPEDRDTLGTLELLARAYEQVDSDLAVEAFQRLSALSESSSGRRPLLRSLLSLASLYRRQGNLLKARTCVELLLEKSREQMDFLYRGEGLLLDGAIFLSEQRYEEASASFQEASRHFSHLDRRAEKAKADLFLARSGQASGSEFLSHLRSSFSVLESLSSVEHEDILLGERDLLSPVVLYGLRDQELRPVASGICLGWGAGLPDSSQSTDHRGWGMEE